MFGGVQTAAQLMVKVGADVAEAQRKLGGMSSTFDNMGKTARMMGVAVGAGLVAAGTAAVVFASKAIDAGSDLAESQNKVNVVFGESAKQIEAWSKTSNRAMGLSRQAALDYAGGMGNLFTQLGAGQSEAANMSQRLVGLSADLASFHNAAGGASEVLDAMSASFRGEYDAMQRYIPTLNAATVEQQALAMTGKATTDQLTAMDKALATQAIMLRDAGAAMGDFARTSGGWANLGRQLQSIVADMTAGIGDRLLPVLEPMQANFVAFAEQIAPVVVEQVGMMASGFAAMTEALATMDLGTLTAELSGLQETLNVDFWAEVFGFLGEQIALTITNFRELVFEIESYGAAFSLIGELITGDVSWTQYRERLAELRQEYWDGREAFVAMYESINERDWQDAVGGLTRAKQAVADLTEGATRNAHAMDLLPAAWSQASTQLLSMAQVWEQAHLAMQGITASTMDANRQKVLDTFAGMANDYATAATTIVSLEQQKAQQLAFLEYQYQQQSAALRAAGENGKLQLLAASHQSQYQSVLAYFNARINTEKAGQQTLFNTSKQYYLATMRVMLAQLRAQVSTVASNMRALVTATVGGYSAMSAAVLAFNRIKAGLTDIAAMAAAMREVQSAYAAIQGAGISAVNGASAAFAEWEAQVGELNSGLDDTAAALSAVGNAGSSAGASMANPLTEAANVVSRLAAMVQNAIDAFDALAQWGGPDARWVQAFEYLVDAMQAMVTRWGAMVAEIAGAGLMADDKRNAMIQLADVITKVAGAVQTALGAVTALGNYEAGFDALNDVIHWISSQAKLMVDEFSAVAGMFEDEVLTAATKFATAAKAALETIGLAVTTLGNFQKFDAQYSYFEAGMWRLKETIVNLVDWLIAVAGGLNQRGVPAAKLFAETAGYILKIIGDAVDALGKFQKFNAQVNYHDLGMWRLKETIVNLVDWLIAVAGGLNQQGIPAARLFSETAGYIMRIIGDAVDVLGRFQTFNAQVNYFELGMWRLKATIVNLVDWLIAVAGGLNREGMPAARLFAETAGLVTTLIGQAVDALTKVQSYVGPAEDQMNAFMRDMQFLLERMVRWVTLIIDPIAEGLSEAMMDALSGLLEALSEGLDLLENLKGYVAPRQAAVEAFMRDMDELVRRFVGWVMGSRSGPIMLLDVPAELMAILQDTMAALGDAVDVLGQLAEYVSPSDAAISNFIADLNQLVMAFVVWVRDSRTGPQMLLEVPEGLMAIFSDVMAALGNAVDVLAGLVDYVSPGEDAIQAFTDDYQALFEGFVAWAARPAGVLNQVPEGLAALFADVMQGLGDAVDTLVSLADYVTPGEDAIQAFTTDYQRVFDDWVSWVTRPAPGTQSGAGVLNQVPEGLAALFADVMQGLGDAVTTLTGIVGYVGPTDQAIDRFTTDYQRIFIDFSDWANVTFTDVALDVVTAVGETAGIVFDGLGAAVETLQAMTYYVGPTANNIDRFMDDMEQVMLRLRDWAVGAFTLESLAFLQAFGQTAGIVFTALGQALDLMSGIAEYTVTGSQFDLALQRFNANLFRMITSWRTWILDIMEPETLALVADFAGVMTQIVNGFRQALNLLMDLQAANLPTAAELEAFLNAVAALFTAVIATFGTVTGQIETMVSNMALQIDAILGILVAVFQSFGVQMQATILTMFTDLGNLMWNRGDYVAGMFMSGLLRGMQNVNSQNAILDAMISLANQLKAVLMAAWGIHSPSRVAMGIGEQFVAGLARGLMDLQGIPAMIEDAVGISLGGPTVRIEPAPQRAYLTVSFEGAWQSGMSPAEERRITGAMVQELRRQGLTILAR